MLHAASLATPDPAADAEIRPHLRAAAALVARRFTDARAHGLAGDIDAAGDRLTELHRSMTGRSGLLAVARVAFGRDAAIRHARTLPAHLVRDDPAPPDAVGEAVRASNPVPRDATAELDGLLAEARSHLLTAHIGNRVGEPGRAAAFAVWEATHRDRVQRWAEGTLSDHQIAINGVVLASLVRPEMRGVPPADLTPPA